MALFFSYIWVEDAKREERSCCCLGVGDFSMNRRFAGPRTPLMASAITLFNLIIFQSLSPNNSACLSFSSLAQSVSSLFLGAALFGLLSPQLPHGLIYHNERSIPPEDSINSWLGRVAKTRHWLLQGSNEVNGEVGEMKSSMQLRACDTEIGFSARGIIPIHELQRKW